MVKHPPSLESPYHIMMLRFLIAVLAAAPAVAQGIVTTVAGTDYIFPDDGKPALQAHLSTPYGLVFDKQGNLFIADPGLNMVLKLDQKGIISVVAGNGLARLAGDGGPARAASLNQPWGLAIDAAGNLYVADTGNRRVRMIDSTGTITSVAGGGQVNPGDGLKATNVNLIQPVGVAFDPAGNMLILDRSPRVRLVNSAGIISTIAGNGTQAFTGDGGPATNATLQSPEGIVVAPDGTIYIADTNNSRVRRIDTKGIITTFAGGGGTPGQLPPNNAQATAVNLAYCDTLGIDSADNVYISSVDLGSIFKINSAGIISRVAGNGSRNQGPGVNGDNGQATAASLSGNLGGIVFDAAGNMYFADSGSNVVRKVDTKGVITTFAGGVDPQTAADLLAGDGGPATKASFIQPSGLAIEKSGNIYIDTQLGLIWIVKPDGTIHRYAGTIPLTAQSLADVIGFSGDGGPASAGRFGTPQGLAVDSSGNVYVADSLNRRVRLIQGGPSPSIVASQKGLTFIAGTNGGAPASQNFTIVNGNQGTLLWTVSASTTSGGNWLSVTPASGSSAAGVAGPPVQVSVNPSGLALGDYYGQVQIQSPNAPNSPQSVTVVLTVRAPGAGTGSIVQPSGLLFTNATPQSLTVSTLSSTAVTFTGTASFGGPPWFTLAPASGTVTSGKPVTVQIVPSAAGLANSVYNGNITFAFSDNSIQNVQLLLVLSGGINRPAAPGERPGAGCAPSKLLPLFTSLGGGFSITTGWPSPVELVVYDDCGTPLTRGSVTATFSNTDPALTLNSLGDGRWTGTWTAQNAASSVNVTASAKAIDSSLTGSAQVSGGLSKNANPPPAIAAGGVLNAASYQLQGSLAPGGLISIFGSLLAQGSVPASSLPLTNSLAGTRVTIAGRTLPLLYAGPNQVNAMIPYDLPINATHQVIVQRGTALSNPEPIGVLSSQSGVFTQDLSGKGAGIVVRVTADGSQSVVATDNPTHPYEALVIYCAGLGSVSPNQVAGAPATFSPLSQTVDGVSVTIGGLDAPVVFAGLTPGFTGLYQVNTYVPAGTAPGDNVPLVITQGGRSSPLVSIAVR